MTFAFIEQHARTWRCVSCAACSEFHPAALRLAVTARKCPLGLQPPTPGTTSAHLCRPSPALRLPARACRPAGRGPVCQPRTGGAPHAPARHPCFGGASVPACTTDSRHDLPIAPNLLKQDFSAARPNTVWLADITYLPTGEGWLYLAAVLDLATRKIVGWSMRDHMRTELSVAALMMAAQRQRPTAG